VLSGSNAYYTQGNVGIGTTGPLALLSVGPQNSVTNNATSMIVGTPSLGTSTDAMNYVAEFRSRSANLDRLLIGEHRTAAGSDWTTGAWRIQPAVDNSFTGVSGNRGYIELSHGSHGSYAGIGLSGTGNTSPDVVVNVAGLVGIGTMAPGSKLEVNGSVKLTANSGASITFQDGTTQSTAYTGVTCGGDYAESVDVTGSRTDYEPGDVLVIDSDVSGKFLKSAEPYSTSVTGIYSTKPGTVGRRQTTPKSDAEVPMAMVGIVPTKVSAENGPIHRGDLLVTSSQIGYAMKGTDRSQMLGAVIGKALDNLESGKGVIEVVVTLQ
jgi:hypothetical protein